MLLIDARSLVGRQMPGRARGTGVRCRPAPRRRRAPRRARRTARPADPTASPSPRPRFRRRRRRTSDPRLARGAEHALDGAPAAPAGTRHAGSVEHRPKAERPSVGWRMAVVAPFATATGFPKRLAHGRLPSVTLNSADHGSRRRQPNTSTEPRRASPPPSRGRPRSTPVVSVGPADAPPNERAASTVELAPVVAGDLGEHDVVHGDGIVILGAAMSSIDSRRGRAVCCTAIAGASAHQARLGALASAVATNLNVDLGPRAAARGPSRPRDQQRRQAVRHVVWVPLVTQVSSSRCPSAKTAR